VRRGKAYELQTHVAGSLSSPSKNLAFRARFSSKLRIAATLPQLGGKKQGQYVSERAAEGSITSPLRASLRFAPVTVVGCRPDGRQDVIFEHVAKPLLHELMCATDELKVIQPVEL
jgi:hypothetical protein